MALRCSQPGTGDLSPMTARDRIRHSHMSLEEGAKVQMITQRGRHSDASLRGPQAESPVTLDF